MPLTHRRFTHVLGALLALAPVLAAGQAAALSPDDPAVRALVEQNRALEKRVEDQQRQIDELRSRLDRLPREPAPAAPTPAPEPSPVSRTAPALEEAGRQVRISGETGLAFFSGGADSAYPNPVFKVDDAKIFIEAPVWHDVYFYGETDLTTREQNDGVVRMGELYVDMEDVAGSRRNNLNLRVGRFYIPFGEEYQHRGVMANPLVTHSAADLWGFDDGVEAYGALGSLQYNLALQSGGSERDLALTARLSLEPVPGLRLSASAHDTGRISVAKDYLTPIWFGGAFFRSIGPAATTHSFAVRLFEADATWRWHNGRLTATSGTARYTDDNPLMDTSRRLTYGSLEGVQQIAGGLSGAARYSAIHVPRGYPIAGDAAAGEYFYNPYAPLATSLWRFSLGLNYEFARPFLWKVEYSWEGRHEAPSGEQETDNLLSTEIGIRF